MPPFLPSFDIADMWLRHTVTARGGVGGPPISADSKNLIHGQLRGSPALAPGDSSVALTISRVFSLRAPAKVREAVISPVSVPVAAFMRGRRRAYESGQNKRMNAHLMRLSVSVKANKKTVAATRNRQNLFNELTADRVFSRQRFDTPKIANFVGTDVADDGLPSFHAGAV